MAMQILITGASGLIGKTLVKQLTNQGHQLRFLSTSASAKPNTFSWNPEAEKIDADALQDVEVIVHLAGAGIMDEPWTAARKKTILDSRVKGTELLAKACREKNIKLKHFISASAIGYYGNCGETLLNEDAPSGEGFAAEVCKKWEASADEFKGITQKISIVRIGIVQSIDRGFYQRLADLAKWKLLAPLGSGKQWVSWIDAEDLCEIFSALINNKLPQGIYNGVAPEPLRNSEITKLIAGKNHNPTWYPPVPAFMLKLMLGERSAEVLSSGNVSCNKLLQAGFVFKSNTFTDFLAKL